MGLSSFLCFSLNTLDWLFSISQFLNQSMASAFALIAVAVSAMMAYLCSGATVNCDRTQACYPWDLGIGPYCGRGNKISLRFTTDIAPENHYELYNTTPPTIMTTVSYGFCPIVDELQAFNLSAAPLLGALHVTNFNASNISTVLYPDENALNFSARVADGYLYAYGFGTTDSVRQPNSSTSTGAVKIISNDTLLCPGGLLVSSFLVLAITLDKGRFKYVSDRANPVGSQFLSTCAGGFCSMDSSQKCIGTELVSNCARCYTNPSKLANATVQIWVSYYGTDVNGRTLLSGSNNPLNFQKFSSTGVWNNLQTSFDNLANGPMPELGPGGSALGG
jgi:hypothetical protein